ncbi:MAG: sugar phosphate isomerase/epimerase, partial [Elusimicrobia bacterium]
MKFGVSTFVWVFPFTTKNIGMLYKVKELGFNGIEIAVENLSAINLREVKKALKATGLECELCGIFNHKRNMISNNPSVRKNAKSYIVDCINACTELESNILCGSVYAAPGKTQIISAEKKERRWDLCVSNLKEMANFAHTKGVIIAIEPLNRYRMDFINTTEEAIRLIEDVNSPGLKLHLDSFHMNIEEKKLGETIRLAGKYLYHFHACENDWGTPGTGHI